MTNGAPVAADNHADDHVDDEISDSLDLDNPVSFFLFADAGSGKHVLWSTLLTGYARRAANVYVYMVSGLGLLPIPTPLVMRLRSALNLTL